MTEQALAQLKDATFQQQDGFAQTLLGVLYFNTRNNQEIVENGYNLIKDAAERKNVRWAYYLSLYIERMSTLDYPIEHYALPTDESLEQLCEHSLRGNVWAMTTLGDILYRGDVTARDNKLGSMLLSKASTDKCMLATDFVNDYKIEVPSNLIERYKYFSSMTELLNNYLNKIRSHL